MSLNYKDLKKLIVKNAERIGKRNTGFKIDLAGLNRDLDEADLGLIAIPYGTMSRRINPDDLPLFVEYYREDKMKWLSDEKYMTTLIFVDKTNIDEELEAILADLAKNPSDTPDIDRVAVIGDILGTYHCYQAVTVAYQNNSPNSVGKNSYFIAVRANKVIIHDPECVYTPPYHVHDDQITDTTDDPIPVDDPASEDDNIEE